MSKKFISLLIIVAMLSVSIIGCGNSSDTSTDTSETVESTEEVTAESSADSSKLVVCLGTEPDYLDPALITTVDAAALVSNAFVGLYTYDENNEIIPAIADGEPEVSEDGLTYTIKLKETCWSNGQPLTAEDFIYSWNRAINPETGAGYEYIFNVIDGYDEGELNVTALDDYTLQIVLSNVCVYFDDLLAFPTFYPVYQADVEAGDEPYSWATEAGFVSNGAYAVTSWDHNNSITYEANSYFYNASEVTMPSVEFVLSADDASIYERFNVGEIDFTTIFPTTEIRTLLSSPVLHNNNALSVYYVGFNVNSDIFSGLTVEQADNMRKAMSLLIDRQYIVDTVGQMEQVTAGSFIPQGMSDGNGGVFNSGSADSYYDASATGASMMEEAMSLLKTCGYSFDYNGDNTYTISPALSVDYLTNESSMHEAIAESIAQDLSVIGIDVNIIVEDRNAFMDDRRNGNYDLAREGWSADFNDPYDMLAIFETNSANNDMQFGRDSSNSSAPDWTAYDNLMTEITTTTDTALRAELMHEALDMLMDTWAVVPLYYYNDVYLQNTSVSGIYSTLSQNRYFMYATKE